MSVRLLNEFRLVVHARLKWLEFAKVSQKDAAFVSSHLSHVHIYEFAIQSPKFVFGRQRNIMQIVMYEIMPFNPHSEYKHIPEFHRVLILVPMGSLKQQVLMMAISNLALLAPFRLRHKTTSLLSDMWFVACNLVSLVATWLRLRWRSWFLLIGHNITSSLYVAVALTDDDNSVELFLCHIAIDPHGSAEVCDRYAAAYLSDVNVELLRIRASFNADFLIHINTS